MCGYVATSAGVLKCWPAPDLTDSKPPGMPYQPRFSNPTSSSARVRPAADRSCRNLVEGVRGVDKGTGYGGGNV